MPLDLLYGRNAVLESLRAGRREHQALLLSETVLPDERIDEIVGRANDLSLAVERLPRGEAERTLPRGNQGVGLRTSPFEYSADPIAPEPAAGSLILALDELEDPRNVGALLRTAEAVGVEGVVLPERRAVAITPAVVNASSGAVEHLRVSRLKNLARWLALASSAGYWCVGLDGGDASENLFDADLPTPAIVVVGSEGRGLRHLTRERCDLLVRIPMYGEIESLNAAAAGSIALYHVREYGT